MFFFAVIFLSASLIQIKLFRVFSYKNKIQINKNCFFLIFLQTDLCGIKWRRLVQGERPNASGDPLDDPVLRSYSRCLAVDILCVWRRVAAPKPDPDPSGNLYDISLSGPGTGTVTHPPLSLSAAKELWIFWYGEEPDLSDLVSPELLKSSGKFFCFVIYIYFFYCACFGDTAAPVD